MSENTTSAEMESLRKENEELRQQRRALLLALFPPDPDAEFNPAEYQPVSLEQLLAEVQKPCE